MGNAVTSCTKQQHTLPPVELEDLHEPEYDRADICAKLEVKLPFAKNHISAFMRCLREAEIECGKKGFVTVTALKNHLKSPAWLAMWTNEPFVKFLESEEMFGLNDRGHLSVVYLQIYAILHCQDPTGNKKKALALYQVVQAVTGIDSAEIARSDSGWDLVTRKMLRFATVDLFSQIKGEELPQGRFTEEECTQIENAIETYSQDFIIDKIFQGETTTLQRKDFITALTSDASSIASQLFSAAILRQRVLYLAQVPTRHIADFGPEGVADISVDFIGQTEQY